MRMIIQGFVSFALALAFGSIVVDTVASDPQFQGIGQSGTQMSDPYVLRFAGRQ